MTLSSIRFIIFFVFLYLLLAFSNLIRKKVNRLEMEYSKEFYLLPAIFLLE